VAVLPRFSNFPANPNFRRRLKIVAAEDANRYQAAESLGAEPGFARAALRSKLSTLWVKIRRI